MILVGAENGGGGFSNKNWACAELREEGQIVKSVSWIGHIVLGKFQGSSNMQDAFSLKKKKAK